MTKHPSPSVDGASRQVADLRRDEERFRALVTATAKIVYRVSADWGEMHCLQGRDFFADNEGDGRNWLQRYVHAMDHGRVREAYEEAIRAGSALHLEHRVTRADGTLGWVSSHAIPLLDERGVVREWFGAATDITERKLADGKLRLVAARQSALLELSDRWRDLPDPADVAFSAAEILGRTLGASRCGNGLFDSDAETITIERDWNAPGSHSMAGIHHFRDYGSYVEALKRGETVVLVDAENDARTNSNVEALRAIDALSLVNLPVEEHGQVVALIYPNSSTPRQWTADELDFIREVAERTRAAVERRRIEQTLRATTAALDFALQSAQVGDWDLDLVHNRSRRSLRHDRCFGYTEAIPENQWGLDTFLRHVHPDDLGHVRREVQAVSEELRDCHFECRVVWPDGSVHWIAMHGSVFQSEAGRPTRMLGIVADITTRKDIEESLGRARERFELVRDAAEVGFWFCDLPFDELLWDTRVKEHFWLAPDARVTIHTFYERMHPEDRERTRAAIKTAIANRTRYAIDYRTVAEDGREKWIRAIGRGFYGADGAPVRFDGVTLDVTDRMRDEEQLRRSIKEAEQSRHQAEAASRAKDDFLAALSHELRTPLNPVLMLAADMATDETIPAEIREDLRMIQRNISLEARLIDDLLDLTRISRGKLQIHLKRTETHALIRQTEEIVRADLAGRKLEMNLRLDASITEVLADPTRLQQVFWNVIKNAVKFTPDGGRITVRTSNPLPGRLRISVEDTGRGISSEVLGRIFNAFDQGSLEGRHAFGGLGLGLSISKALVDLHGGTLQAVSEGVGRGAVFTVELETAGKYEV